MSLKSLKKTLANYCQPESLEQVFRYDEVGEFVFFKDTLQILEGNC